VHLVRGEGVWLYDREGRAYLDCYNNVASVGHCHPRVVEAMAAQAGVLATHTRYLHDGILDYAERLLALFPASFAM
jgi:4-aminobutyrate aminotransferase-like enzyme